MTYWKKLTDAEIQQRLENERKSLITRAKWTFPNDRLTDSEISILSQSWKLTDTEIAKNWSVYPCQLNWAIRRGGCGCTARGTQFCLTERTKTEILEILPACR